MQDYFNQNTLLKLENWSLKSPDGYVGIDGFDFVILTKKKFNEICEALNFASDYLCKENYHVGRF